MDMAEIIALLRREIGLNPDSMGENVVQQAIGRRIVATACKDIAEYVTRLSASRDEVQELVEEVTVPETWFFREQTAFECLRRHAMLSSGVLMVASMPCATGEEPYSIAMSLLELGLPASRFRVHALDISHRALLLAQRGEYGEHAFRAADNTFRRHYFAPAATGYRVNQTVRDQVSFYHGSLLAPPPPFATGSYDVVFCRNLLIYLDEEARLKVVAELKRMLSGQGILLVGHAEAAILIQQGFRRREDGALTLAARPVEVLRPSRQKRPPPTARPVPFSDMPAAAQQPDAENENTAIRSLADQGLLDEARLRCEKNLAMGQHSAELYCMLGLVLHAKNDVEGARECYRKALYLDPRHQEASLQLAMLLDKAGEMGRACSLRAAARKRGGMHG